MSSLREAEPEMTWEVIPRAGMGDVLSPTRTARGKVGTRLTARKTAESASSGAWQE